MPRMCICLMALVFAFGVHFAIWHYDVEIVTHKFDRFMSEMDVLNGVADGLSYEIKLLSGTASPWGIYLRDSPFFWDYETDLRSSFLPGIAYITLKNHGGTPLNIAPISKLDLQYLRLSGNIADYSPIQSLRLNVFDASSCPYIDNITFLHGMSLTELHIQDTAISDLSPLKGMPIHTLRIQGSKVRDLSALRGMPIQELDLFLMEIVDLSGLDGVPLRVLDVTGNPGFDAVTDLSPLRGAPLEILRAENSRVKELAPLEGAPLRELSLNGAPIENVYSLRSSMLTKLNLMGCRELICLKGLEDLPLEILNISYTNVTDLTPIHHIPLKELYIDHSMIPLLEQLRDSPIQRIQIYLDDNSIDDFSLPDALPDSMSILYI